MLVSAQAWSQPLAEIRGIEDPDMLASLQAVIGETEPDRDGQGLALQRARMASERAGRWLRAEGYYAARVEARVERGATAVIMIDPGPRFSIQEIAVEIVSEDPGVEAERARTHVLEALPLEPGAPLVAAQVIDAETIGRVALQNGGWPDAQTGERSVTVDHAVTGAQILYRYETGPFSRYGEIELVSAGWDEAFIARLSPLETGAEASAAQLQGYRNRLVALPGVSSAQVELGPVGDGGHRPLHVALESGPRHTIDVALDASTSDGAGAKTNWTRRNLFGREEALTLGLQVATLTQSAEARISLPHWRRYDQTLALTTRVKTEDTDAFEQRELSAQGELTWRRDAHLQLGVSAQGDISRITDANGQRDTYTLLFGLGAGYDRRSDPLDPRDGVRGMVALRPAMTFGDTDARYFKLEAEGSYYRSLGEDLTGAIRVRAGSIFGAEAADLPADLRFYAGGGGSVRGYAYQTLSPPGADGDPFGGLSVFETSLEMRWRSPRSPWGAVAFIDAGAASDNAQLNPEDVRTAIGVGVRYDLGFAPLRLDVAVPLERLESEDAFQVYLSLGQAF